MNHLVKQGLKVSSQTKGFLLWDVIELIFPHTNKIGDLNDKYENIKQEKNEKCTICSVNNIYSFDS